MGKKPKRCPKKCQSHKFLLKPVHYSAVFSRELQASFCPAHLADPSITPKFNKDKRHYTTSFFLPIDHEKLQTNAEYYRTEHERYKVENILEKSEMLLPKPKSKYSYCSVCKADYEDYIKHIRSENHKNKLKDNKFNSYINELCQEMKEQSFNTILESQEYKNLEQIDLKPSIFSQETSIFDPSYCQKQSINSFQGYEYKQINDWLHSCKTFHLIPDGNEPNLPFLHEDQEGVPTHPPISPFKRCSEPTQGIRQVCNLKPIILFGGNNCQINS